MLKLIINNAYPVKGNDLSQGNETKTITLKDSFAPYFQEFSPNLYIFKTKDYAHDLLCEMTLELKEILISLEEEGEEGAYLAPVVACSFPTINLQKFHEKIGFDGYLQAMLMCQFQLKILEQLLLFCEQKDAVNLILTINDTDLDYLEIYSRFLISEEQVITAKGEQTQIVIPTDVETYDAVVDFMDKIDKSFHQTLWREQKVNPTFRDYLKVHS